MLESHVRDDLLIVPTLLEEKAARRLGLSWSFSPRPLTPMMIAISTSSAGARFLEQETEAMLSRVGAGRSTIPVLIAELESWFKAGPPGQYSTSAILYAIADQGKEKPDEFPNLVKWAKAATMDMEKCARAVQLSSIAVRCRNPEMMKQ